jgi:methyltransferase-like protein
MGTNYDLNSMRIALINCDKNIKVFEEAIQKERNTIEEYQRIIQVLEEQENNPPKVEIDIVREE